jgi:hypothetical protein
MCAAELLLEASDLRADGRLRHTRGDRGVRDGAVVDEARNACRSRACIVNKIPLLPANTDNATLLAP